MDFYLATLFLSFSEDGFLRTTLFLSFSIDWFSGIDDGLNSTHKVMNNFLAQMK